MVEVVRLLDDDDNTAYPSTICPHSLISGPLLQTSSKTMVYNYSELCMGVLAGPDVALLILLAVIILKTHGKLLHTKQLLSTFEKLDCPVDHSRRQFALSSFSGNRRAHW